jgi:hypothetical protein
LEGVTGLEAAVDERDLQAHLLGEHKLRIQPAMSRYVLEKVQAGGDGVVAVIGGDARTGRPRRAEVSLAELAKVSPVIKSELS